MNGSVGHGKALPAGMHVFIIFNNWARNSVTKLVNTAYKNMDGICWAKIACQASQKYNREY